MPPEWHQHKRSWMAWPCRLESWKDKLNQARIAYKELALQISEFEPVCILYQLLWGRCYLSCITIDKGTIEQ